MHNGPEKKESNLAPRIYEGGGRRPGGVRIFSAQICEKPTFHRKVGTPSDPVAPGFARIHRPTSPINGGGKSFLDTLTADAFASAVLDILHYAFCILHSALYFSPLG